MEAFTPESLEKIKHSVGEIKKERARVIEGLKTIEAVRHIFPSNANFVLFRMDHSYGVYKAVADLGVSPSLSFSNTPAAGFNDTVFPLSLSQKGGLEVSWHGGEL